MTKDYTIDHGNKKYLRIESTVPYKQNLVDGVCDDQKCILLYVDEKEDSGTIIITSSYTYSQKASYKMDKLESIHFSSCEKMVNVIFTKEKGDKAKYNLIQASLEDNNFTTPKVVYEGKKFNNNDHRCTISCVANALD